MKTLVLNDDEAGISKATDILKSGGLVAIPTETVYGLAANALNKKAVKDIYIAKGRPSDNPLIVHTTSLEQARPLLKNIPDKAKLLADKFWPGALTVIMEKSSLVPYETSGGLQSVAVRVPDNTAALRLLEKSRLFLAAPSANTSGKPSPTSCEHVLNDLNGKIDAVLDAGKCRVGIESTIVSLLGDEVRLLRPGKITVEQLQSVVGDVVIDKAVLQKPPDDKKVLSPGMKYKHYAPKANITLIKSDSSDFITFINENFTKSMENTLVLCYNEEAGHINANAIALCEYADYDTMAQNMFSVLRDIDKNNNIENVYVHSPSERGVGLAVYNRLIRASGFQVIEIENGKQKQ